MIIDRMRILIYKRTHKGDPDKTGRFGIHDCMGEIRSIEFDAVIGIGGIGSEPKSEGIDGKVNWIGIGSRKEQLDDRRGPLVWFDHFVLFEDKGPDFQTIAPTLARRMYSKNIRLLLNFTEIEQVEVGRLLEIAQTAPPSTKASLTRRAHRCPRCWERTTLFPIGK